MDKEPPKIEDPEVEKKAEWAKVLANARALCEQIHQELDRIEDMPDGWKLHARLWEEIFRPARWDKESLYACAVYHGMIGSSITYERTPQIDLPGEDNLMSFYTKKLAELQEIKTATSS